MTLKGGTAPTAAEGEDRENGQGKATPRVALTPRDRELLLHLAFVRHLTGAQLEQLCFAGKSESIAGRRLRRLLDGKYLRRIPYRDSAGHPALAWALDVAGYLIARRTCSALPPIAGHDVSPEFLEHDLRLNDLYIALSVAARQKKITVERRPFRWSPSSAARLPWREYDRETNTEGTRVIRPDAVLELLPAKRRIFIEAEMGSHTLGFRTDNESKGTTRRKIERYTRFIADPCAPGMRDTYYESAFPDRWEPELLFVVPTEARRGAITEYVEKEWRPANAGVRLLIRALNFDEAGVQLCRDLHLPAGAASLAAPAGLQLTTGEARAIYEFYNFTIGAIQSVRELARRQPGSGLSVPEYPPTHAAVKDLCARLAEVLR